MNSIYDPTIPGRRIVTPADFSTVPINNLDNTTVSGSNGTVFQLKTGFYREFTIQNLSTGKLYVKLGAGASNATFNVLLKGGAATVADANGDGAGATYTNNKWPGLVSCSGEVPKYIAWKLEN